MAKRAFFVLAPESSGGRLLTQCLIAAGCEGDATHAQRFDRPEALARAGDLIVWRRSLPHAQCWPDLDGDLARLQQHGYRDVRVIALVRNDYCTVRSQVWGCEPHTTTFEQAGRQVTGALRRIASFVLENNLPCRWMTYESVISESQRDIFKRALAEWGLDLTALPSIRDENQKYLEAWATLPPS